MAVNQSAVTVTSAATLVLASKPGRRMFVIKNNGTVIIYLGTDTSVTSTNGIPLMPQDSFSQNGSRMYMGAWYGITASSTADVRYIDYNE